MGTADIIAKVKLKESEISIGKDGSIVQTVMEGDKFKDEKTENIYSFLLS